MIRSETRMCRKLMPNGLTQNMSRVLRVAHRDVPGHALAEPEPTEDPERAGELLLAVEPLLRDGGERRRLRQRDALLGRREPGHAGRAARAGSLRGTASVQPSLDGAPRRVLIRPSQPRRQAALGRAHRSAPARRRCPRRRSAPRFRGDHLAAPEEPAADVPGLVRRPVLAAGPGWTPVYSISGFLQRPAEAPGRRPAARSPSSNGSSKCTTRPAHRVLLMSAPDDAGVPDEPEQRASLRADIESAVADVHGYSPDDAEVPAGATMPRWTCEGGTRRRTPRRGSAATRRPRRRSGRWSSGTVSGRRVACRGPVR